MAPSGIPTRHAAIPALSERMHGFRSLGGNCEFGFVQRYGGAEPSGLLRFAATPLDALIRALADDFDGYGEPGDLVVEATATGAYYGRSRRYGVWWNTMQLVGRIEPEALLAREYGRVAHLRQKLLEELRTGSVTFVRTTAQGESDADLDRLAAAIARHGPAPLLRVKAAGPDWAPEPVRQVADGVFEGRVRRFSADDQAWIVDLEPWLALCDAAYAARHGLPVDALAPGPRPDRLPLPGGLRRCRGRPGVQGLSPFTRAVDPAAFDREASYVFSAWVWIPEGCAATRIFATAGLSRLGWADADLNRRGCWQRVWAAGRFGPAGGAREPVGLGMVGGPGDWFWSCRPAFHEGVLPRPVSAPRMRPWPAPARWLTHWLDRPRRFGAGPPA